MQVGCEQGRLSFHDSEEKIGVSKLRPANLKHKTSKPYVSWEFWNRFLSYPAVSLKTHLPTLHPGCLCCYACGSLPGPAYRHHVISRPDFPSLYKWESFGYYHIYSYIIFVGCIFERKRILLSFHFSLAAWQVASRPVGNSSAAVPFAPWFV